MSDKKNFMLRVDAEMFKALEKWAADEFRSVNGQIEYLLNKALKDNKRLKSKNPEDKSEK
ncbi:hypothetical protein [Sphingobacterium spiritivorum]|uniref:Arc-like DNA binding domain-containing protein n=1 Tax=Sphingobacterium spiritivorum ATCC 33861 TaxID=525373 RepID=D7VPF9_SPHSI|nr:hypothetical protein [Sphingobacterium spiritivorum]EFK57806.1 hypothetical protein HMPREF0766_12879 [Sphingobacterium spiritivorum ATCC 33861]QQT36165.1 Arc family DNA binding domain-containing protein [Sphingobacterium spiritivorum]WQD32902.1 Arc family DNA binding domain-containing protein [Sphingobacterium spiritivorum]SUJ16305.1 Uncharacterised protein [Sphingobacterium spiritivorum]